MAMIIMAFLLFLKVSFAMKVFINTAFESEGFFFVYDFSLLQMKPKKKKLKKKSYENLQNL
jgi:signal transduction histidine kinase